MYWIKKGCFFFSLNQLIGTDIAERPIQDEDSTQKKMLSKSTGILGKKIMKLTKQPTYYFSYVYMIDKRKQTDSYVKIGCTENPQNRISQLQQGNAEELDYALVIKVPDGKKYEAEKVAQEFFLNENLNTKPYLRGGSEWFDIGGIGIERACQIIIEKLQEKHLFIANETKKFKK